MSLDWCGMMFKFNKILKLLLYISYLLALYWKIANEVGNLTPQTKHSNDYPKPCFILQNKQKLG